MDTEYAKCDHCETSHECVVFYCPLMEATRICTECLKRGLQALRRGDG